ncbi:NAD(P)H-binding protein [Pararhizobium sp. PWRC1-1]|uniref:NmrA family NAD(P)-binding protein n=1 Tax=Pararhizobium sp. PWRC1-1 TaxID=2804566 RepID=UPI003CE83854
MAIFLTGAGGYIGGEIGQKLVNAGYGVRGLVRNADQIEKLSGSGIQPVLGMLEDYELLLAEARHSSGVIRWYAGPSWASPLHANNSSAIY